MSLRRFRDMVLMGIREFRDPYYQGFAAQIAFYFMMSIVPIVLLLSQVLGFFSISIDYLYEYMQRYLKGNTADFLLNLLKSSPSGTINLFMIIIALWAASKAQFALARIANYMANNPAGKGWVRERFRAVTNIVVTLATLTLSLVVLVYFRPILAIVFSTVIQNPEIQQQISELIYLLRYPVMFFIYVFMISFNYYVLPTKKVRYREVLPGSIFAAIGMLVASWIFMMYTNNITGYNLLYGSLASLVILMLWFILLAWILCLGMFFNKALKETRKNI